MAFNEKLEKSRLSLKARLDTLPPSAELDELKVLSDIVFTEWNDAGYLPNVQWNNVVGVISKLSSAEMIECMSIGSLRPSQVIARRLKLFAWIMDIHANTNTEKVSGALHDLKEMVEKMGRGK